jgi:uncharacterized radical SAM superfamily protein
MAPRASDLFNLPWAELRAAAWDVRQRHFEDDLAFAVPGAKRYETEHYRNSPHRFASVSLTGTHCDLLCEHCRGRLLVGMLPAPDEASLDALGQQLVSRGCEGLLISGGADEEGAVPLLDHLAAIGRLKERGLTVIVHTGLVDRETAEGLRDAGVDQVLFDVIGDERTIHDVLHLDRTPQDYAAALRMLREVGLRVAPHIVVGLHFGTLRGELAALDTIREVGAEVVVLVVLRPLPRTPMADTQHVAPGIVGKLTAAARILHPTTPLTLGCARPAGPDKITMERMAVEAGVNAVAYPDPSTVDAASALGLRTQFVESCCTLAAEALLKPKPTAPVVR